MLGGKVSNFINEQNKAAEAAAHAQEEAIKAEKAAEHTGTGE